MKSDIIVSREDFDIRRILDCGQVFRYFPEEGGYTVISGDKLCCVTQDEARAVISSDDPDYFADYFDLSADYSAIRENCKTSRSCARRSSTAEGYAFCANSRLRR